MAIKINNYYEHFYSSAVAKYLISQLVLIILVGGSMWLLLQATGVAPEYILGCTLIVMATAQIALGPILLKSITKPLKVIAQAVAHVSPQAGKTPAPMINTEQYEQSGLRAVVKAIYDLTLVTNQPVVHEEGEISPMPATSPQALQDLLNSMPCGVISLHADRSMAYYNGLAPIEIHPGGKPNIELLFDPNDTLEMWLTDCETKKVRDTKIWRRVSNKLPDDENLRIFDVIGYYQKGNEQGIEIILVTIDRTPDYAPDQEDMDFIALAAHELRGPITVIRGYLDVLSQELAPVLQPDQNQLIERLSVSANRLSGYINNILNVSRYDRKHLKLHLHEDRLPDILRSLLDDLQMRARTQNRLLGFTVPEDLPTVAADRDSVSEVISNLVDNAIKYSQEGGQIIVHAEVKGNFVEVTVQDFGIGMPGSIVGNLFNKFYRSHRSRQTVGGTGLGLYISKAIVESHGGGIWVRSTEGKGSTFGFTLPIYATVAEKLKNSNNGNEGIIESASGWIRNHSMYRR